VNILATGHRSEFGYDGWGRRVCIRELDPDATSTLQVSSDKKYLWDDVEIAQERTTDGGTVLRRFYRQGFVDTDGTVLFYTRDRLGSIRELTDRTQSIQARIDYDPWGQMTKITGTRISPIGYAGYFWHAPSGLDLAVFRAYDPGFGRWISRDPLEEAGGLNLYLYVANRPTIWFDPLGLCPCYSSYSPNLLPGSADGYVIKDCRESCAIYGDMNHCKIYTADPGDTSQWNQWLQSHGYESRETAYIPPPFWTTIWIYIKPPWWPF
jgi:RHS repeat-associated protein